MSQRVAPKAVAIIQVMIVFFAGPEKEDHWGVKLKKLYVQQRFSEIEEEYFQIH